MTCVISKVLAKRNKCIVSLCVLRNIATPPSLHRYLIVTDLITHKIVQRTSANVGRASTKTRDNEWERKHGWEMSEPITKRNKCIVSLCGLRNNAHIPALPGCTSPLYDVSSLLILANTTFLDAAPRVTIERAQRPATKGRSESAGERSRGRKHIFEIKMCETSLREFHSASTITMRREGLMLQVYHSSICEFRERDSHLVPYYVTKNKVEENITN